MWVVVLPVDLSSMPLSFLNILCRIHSRTVRHRPFHQSQPSRFPEIPAASEDSLPFYYYPNQTLSPAKVLPLSSNHLIARIRRLWSNSLHSNRWMSIVESLHLRKNMLVCLSCPTWLVTVLDTSDPTLHSWFSRLRRTMHVLASLEVHSTWYHTSSTLYQVRYYLFWLRSLIWRCWGRFWWATGWLLGLRHHLDSWWGWFSVIFPFPFLTLCNGIITLTFRWWGGNPKVISRDIWDPTGISWNVVTTMWRGIGR